MISDGIHAAAVQEITLSQKELVSFKHYAFTKGYRFFGQLGAHLAGHPSRGAGVLVHKHLKSHLLNQWGNHECQAVGVNIEGLNLLSVYVSVRSYSPQVPQEILQFLTEQIPQKPWLMVGDFNNEPHEYDLIQVLKEEGASVLAVTDEQGRLQPTRFEGNRAIDYGITNSVGAFSKPQFLEAKVSDHKNHSNRGQGCVGPTVADVRPQTKAKLVPAKPPGDSGTMAASGLAFLVYGSTSSFGIYDPMGSE